MHSDTIFWRLDLGLLKGMVKSLCDDVDEYSLIRQVTLYRIPKPMANAAEERFLLFFEFNPPSTPAQQENLQSLRYFLSPEIFIKNRDFQSVYKFPERYDFFNEWVLTNEKPPWGKYRESVIVYREDGMFSKVYDGIFSFFGAVSAQWLDNKKAKDKLSCDLIRALVLVEQHRADYIKAEMEKINLDIKKSKTEARGARQC